jgi:hypothetical protein
VLLDIMLNLLPTVPSAAAAVAGGYFDPLNLADGGDPDKVFRLKTAEIKHGRLAMIAFAGAGGCAAAGRSLVCCRSTICTFCTMQQCSTAAGQLDGLLNQGVVTF